MIIVNEFQGKDITEMDVKAIFRLVDVDKRGNISRTVIFIMIQYSSELYFHDDVRLFMYPVVLGWRWTSQGLEYSEEWKKAEVGMTGMEKTTEVLLAMMNSVFKTIKFTIETKDEFSSGTGYSAVGGV